MENKDFKTPIYIRNANKRYHEKNRELLNSKKLEYYYKKKQEKNDAKNEKNERKTTITIDSLILREKNE